MKTISRAASAAIILLLVILSVTLLTGCSAEPSSETSGPSTTADATPSTAPAATSSTTPPVTLSQYEKDLADTANVVNSLIQYLGEQGVADNDPRVAMVFGLRARTVALFCRKSLAENDLDNARTAMTDVYSNLNRGRNVAQGDMAETLENAYKAIETVGDPTVDPAGAATRLDQFIALLEPLLDEAGAMIGSGGTADTSSAG